MNLLGVLFYLKDAVVTRGYEVKQAGRYPLVGWVGRGEERGPGEAFCKASNLVKCSPCLLWISQPYFSKRMRFLVISHFL